MNIYFSKIYHLITAALKTNNLTALILVRCSIIAITQSIKTNLHMFVRYARRKKRTSLMSKSRSSCSTICKYYDRQKNHINFIFAKKFKWRICNENEFNARQWCTLSVNITTNQKIPFIRHSKKMGLMATRAVVLNTQKCTMCCKFVCKFFYEYYAYVMCVLNLCVVRYFWTLYSLQFTIDMEFVLYKLWHLTNSA